ncbi:SMI1/KNR4 family protein [Streptomyces sp. NPDC004647]|uniref:SMI1/KNR4 family protein n=1 Tax=Streptomyces sp. NPDC004647 TaxID=3154671 RepID=UPI0033AEE5BF
MPNPSALQRAWSRIEPWLADNAPADHASLRPPANATDIHRLESALEIHTIHPDVIELLKTHDGADDRYPTVYQPGAGRFIPSRYRFLSTHEICERANGMNRQLAEDDPDSTMVGYYWHPRWVPIAQETTTCLLFIDHRPGPTYGAVGELIEGDHAYLAKWPSLAELLTRIADSIEHDAPLGRYTPQPTGGRGVSNQRRIC